MLHNKVLIISKIFSLLMHVFQHLILNSSIYSFVKTASEEWPAKLHNYAKYQSLIIHRHIRELSELLTLHMSQCKVKQVSVCATP